MGEFSDKSEINYIVWVFNDSLVRKILANNLEALNSLPCIRFHCIDESVAAQIFKLSARRLGYFVLLKILGFTLLNQVSAI